VARSCWSAKRSHCSAISRRAFRSRSESVFATLRHSLASWQYCSVLLVTTADRIKLTRAPPEQERARLWEPLRHGGMNGRGVPLRQRIAGASVPNYSRRQLLEDVWRRPREPRIRAALLRARLTPIRWASCASGSFLISDWPGHPKCGPNGIRLPVLMQHGCTESAALPAVRQRVGIGDNHNRLRRQLQRTFSGVRSANGTRRITTMRMANCDDGRLSFEPRDQF
jgi:hypothetical protein